MTQTHVTARRSFRIPVYLKHPTAPAMRTGVRYIVILSTVVLALMALFASVRQNYTESLRQNVSELLNKLYVYNSVDNPKKPHLPSTVIQRATSEAQQSDNNLEYLSVKQAATASIESLEVSDPAVECILQNTTTALPARERHDVSPEGDVVTKTVEIVATSDDEAPFLATAQPRLPTSLFEDHENSTHLCYHGAFDAISYCRLKCREGHFSLPNMTTCHPYLRCSDLDQIQILDEFCEKGSDLKCRHHYVKQLFLADWQGHQVVLANSSLGWHGLGDKWDRTARYLFVNGQKKLRELQGNHSHVINYIGGCSGRWFATQFYKNGGLADFEKLLHQSSHDTLEARFHLCRSYAGNLQFLKHSPVGPLVMADSDTVLRTLSQFIISDSLNVVLADVDMLPAATNGTICRTNRTRPFTAPEQDCPSNRTEMVETETAKTDSWKFPFICRELLNERHHTKPQLHAALRQLFDRCLHEEPSARPDADEIVSKLDKISLEQFDKLA